MDYNRINPSIATALKAASGAGNYLDGADIGADMSHDERALYGTASPEAVIYAVSTEQVAEVIKVCAENRVPVTTRGAGTGLAGGAVAVQGGVVLCTARMNRILAKKPQASAAMPLPTQVAPQLINTAPPPTT